MALVIIDCGHGGHDNGASGKYSKEKDNVLKVGLRLKSLLEQAGHNVKMTRSTDKYLTLGERSTLSNVWKADYFISLHNNSAKNKSATGFETFAYNGEISSKTVAFQRSIHKAILGELKIRDRGLKRANFAVLRNTQAPAVLIEYAFVSNDDDEKILINKVEQMAVSTAQGIINSIGGKQIPTTKPKPSSPAKEIIANSKGEIKMMTTSSGTLKKAYQDYLQDAINKKIIQPKWLQEYNAGKLTVAEALHLDILISANQ